MIQGSLSLMSLHQVFNSAGAAEGVFAFEQGKDRTLVAVRDGRIIWVSRGGAPLDPFDALVALMDLAYQAHHGKDSGSFVFEPRPTRDLVELKWPATKVVEQVLVLADERSQVEREVERDPLLLDVVVRPKSGGKTPTGAVQVAYKEIAPRLRRGVQLRRLARDLRVDPVWLLVLLRKLEALGVLSLEGRRGEEVNA